jgi:hypothetical protein
MADTAAPAGHAEAQEDVERVGSLEQLRWFSTFWVMAMALHHTDNEPWKVFPTLVVGISMLAYPTSVPLLCVFLAVTTVLTAMGLPGIANHQVLALLVALGMGGAALWVLARRGDDADRRAFAARWLDTARGPVVLTLLVVYFFTVFHKLNDGFFSLDSCAGDLLRRGFQLNGLPAPELGRPLVLTLAVGTILVESSILVLLAVRRTRRWGLLIGIGFHCLLVPASFYDFATTVFALYLLLVPPRVFAAIEPRSAGLRDWALAFFGLHLLVSLSVAMAGMSGSVFGVQFHTLQVLTWYPAVLPFLIVLLRAVFADRGPWPALPLRPAVLLLVPLLAFVNGVAPYVGIKTTSTYSMFSNLHVEAGATNHLLPWANALELAPFTRDVVTVHRVEHPEDIDVEVPLWMDEKPPQVLPYLELRLAAEEMRKAGVTGEYATLIEYERNGVRRVVPDAAADPVLAAPIPWWQSRLLSFRAADSGSGRDLCRW